MIISVPCLKKNCHVAIAHAIRIFKVGKIKSKIGYGKVYNIPQHREPEGKANQEI